MPQDSSRRDQPADRPAVAAEGSVEAAARALTADGARVAAARRLRPGVGTLAGLDRLAELAARLLGVGSGRISLLTDVQQVAGAAGPQPAGGERGEEPLAQRLCTRTAASGAPLAIADTTADERVAGPHAVTPGVVGSYLGVPLTVDGGHVVGVVCVFEPAPRSWSERDAALLQQVAAAAVAELELTALSGEYASSRALLELTIGAAELGTFDLDLATGVLTVNDRMLELVELTAETFSGAPEDVYARLHPADRESTIAAVQEAVGSGGEYRVEHRVVLPGGGYRWVAARGATQPGPDGAPARLLGVAFDVTSAREAGARVEHVLDSMAVAYLAVDTDWRVTYLNAEAARITGTSRERLVGRDVWEAFPAAAGTVFEEHYRRAAATGETVVFDAFYPAPLQVWVEVRVVPEGGRPNRGLALYFLDVTARKHAQHAAEAARRSAEAAAARQELLAAISRELSGALEAERAVTSLAQLVVPALGDWCVVSLVDDDAPASTPAGVLASTAAGRPHQLRRGLRDVGCWHRDEALLPLVEEYAEHRLGELTDTAFLWRALRHARPVPIPDATRAVTAVLEPGGRVREALARLAPSWAAIFPLRGRGRTVGLLTLFTGPDRAPLSPQEMSTAAEVADRAGLALDSARLYRQQRELAEGLQRSLLSEPPEPDHGQIVVRYLPAAEAAQVGGDWYDAFLQPSGATVLVIGDVVGHDTQAAAAMSQVRTVVRTLGALADDSPAQVLAGTDRVMANLEITTTATAVVARLEQSVDERRRGVTRLRWSSAGHPPAMVVHPDGSVLPLAGVHADLLLGVLPDAERRDSEVLLDRGSTVVLYTDGLVERRDQPLHEGLEKLHRVLEELAADDLDLDSLVDRMLRRMLPPAAEDDVAVVAVRLHPQDRPRPAEAGPNRVPPHVPDEPDVPPLRPAADELSPSAAPAATAPPRRA
ncbi:SpoIIE family protein phosphatase [Paenibacillus sp. TRM 82003]|uniref:SpoIIE family protein phosphatase n=1 Tax=Kineococcus sp. TRM81007 TaxID=2925831 RepID=UPI001F57247D|nr:SpoIIE family protein phosphatase [Kineococcus sp. TRM81007]MCI2236908.1 SpoIIE family protein phosphatase [Kineococcus sp. TRM81007]MCI3921900.1 SpoIIE family protein phosphatase [Paenibacillus sp. TRM 82003]